MTIITGFYILNELNRRIGDVHIAKIQPFSTIFFIVETIFDIKYNQPL